LTEKLVESVAERQGVRALDGGKYGSNNGYDHVLRVGQDASGNVMILVADSKQMAASGSMKLSVGAGGELQLSAGWIDAVMGRIQQGSEAWLAIDAARTSGTIRTAVAGVDKATGNLVIVPVKVVP
jgi:filamentous hemagglutinin